MEKYIYDQSNVLWYELQGDCYIPCLMLNEPDTAPIGMWGRKHQQYLKEYRPMLYSDLVLSGGLHSYLADIDTQARNKLHLLVTQLAEKEGMATMTDEQKELFSRYTDVVREYQTMAECLLFQNSFKLGARMMLEVMEE